MKIKVGELKNGVPVYISERSPNQHISVFGVSGTGKSTRIREIVSDIICTGGTVIAFDINGEDFQEKEEYLHRISAVDEGMNLNFFDDFSVKNGLESYESFLAYFIDCIANVFGLGVRQAGAMREAAEFAIEHRVDFDTEMQALAEGLETQSSAVAQGVYNKIWNFLHCNVFRKSEKSIKKGAVNVISLKGLNPSTQREIIEIFLAYFWKMRRIVDTLREPTTIVIDEFQNLSLKKNSVLLEMLREARKYNVSLLLATQSNTGFSKEVMNAINQTAIQLYFRPTASEIKKIAEILEPQNSGHWILKLKMLKVGESVVIGNIIIAGKEMTKPIITYSHFENSATNRRNLLLRQ